MKTIKKLQLIVSFMALLLSPMMVIAQIKAQEYFIAFIFFCVSGILCKVFMMVIDEQKQN